MADRKITAFGAITGANTASDDVLPLVDVSETVLDDKNKKITLDNLSKSISDGAAATPSIAFRDDQDTGIFSPSANNLAATTGGSERLRVDSSGRLLINRTTLSTVDTNAKLQVNGTADIDGILIHSPNSAVTGENLSIGEDSLREVLMQSSCQQNVAIGQNAITAPLTAKENVAVGKEALEDLTTGSYNTALGFRALKQATTANYSTGIGYKALSNVGAASISTALGGLAGAASEGGKNVFVGYGAGAFVNPGDENTIVGHEAVGITSINLAEVSFNTAFGYRALYSLESQDDENCAFGHKAGYNIAGGSRNICIGKNAGEDITTGSANIVIGDLTASGGSSPVHAITTADNRVVMGTTAVTNAYIQVAWTVVSDERDKTNFGDVPHGIEFVKALNPIAFQFREDRESDVAAGPVRYGFSAQEIINLEGANPVIIDNEDPNRLKYRGESLVPVLVNAIKEQQEQIDALQARIDALEAA